MILQLLLAHIAVFDYSFGVLSHTRGWALTGRIDTVRINDPGEGKCRLGVPGGINAINANNIQILNNNPGDSKLSSGTGAKIDNNKITNLTVDSAATNFAITNNQISGNLTIAPGTSNATVTGNTIGGNVVATGVSGIQLNTNNIIGFVNLTTAIAPINLVNNEIIGDVPISSGNNAQLTGNTISGSVIATGVAGINLNGNTITGNVSASNGTTPVTLTNNIITGNVPITGGSNAQLIGNTIGGTVTATTVSGIKLDNNKIGSLALTGAPPTNSATVTNNTISGSVLVNGGSGHNLDTNRMGSLTLTGSATGPIVNKNAIVGATVITGPGITNATITANRMGSMAVNAPSSGNISGNDIGGVVPGRVLPASGTIALDLQTAFNGPIDHNDIHDADIGLNYAVPNAVINNRIFKNVTGVVMPINNTAGGLGYFPGSGTNDIFNNTTGVNLTGLMQLQHIYSNVTGVIGNGTLGTDSFATANLIKTNQVGTNFAGLIQFTKLAANGIGIAATSGQKVFHNLIYRSTQYGIFARGVTDVRIVNNTFYAPQGDNINVQGGSTNVEVRNNILWAESGYDVYVANNSQIGFFSDYNDLHTSGTGKVFYWTKDFTDILDLQADVALLDLHSIGRTAVNPNWSEPRFLNKAADDYRISDLVAGQRSSSPTIDAGDPLADQGLPTFYNNLLANAGFENGVTGWAVNVPDATTVGGNNPSPFDGSKYFFAGNTSQGFAEQTLNLTSAAFGFTNAQLDSEDFVVDFGGRIRSLAQVPTDKGQITLTFLDGSNQPIGVVPLSLSRFQYLRPLGACRRPPGYSYRHTQRQIPLPGRPTKRPIQ